MRKTPWLSPSTYGTLGPRRAEEDHDALIDRELRRADNDAAEAAERRRRAHGNCSVDPSAPLR